MILHLLEYFNSKRIILASQSPRRSDLLKGIGLKFETIPTNCDENKIEQNAGKRVLINAKLKTNAVAKKLKEFDLIIGSDTIVCFKQKIFEKPKSKQDAFDMLSQLSGQTHDVITGVSLLFNSHHIFFYEKSRVELFQFQNAFINLYIESGEPMDKAGAYGIQSSGSSFVKKISGCFYNVMGLPVSRICHELLKAHSERFI